MPGDEPDADMLARLRAAETIGRPLGDDRFLTRIERLTKHSPSRASGDQASRIRRLRVLCIVTEADPLQKSA